METTESSLVTIFICVNCGRQGSIANMTGPHRPEIPEFDLPAAVETVILPCAGRLQPEHVLKAFDAGSTVVAVLACEERNCHYAEGSRRCGLRIDYLRPLLEEIGLGEGRLVFCRLQETCEEGAASLSGRFEHADVADSFRIAAVRDQVLEALRLYPSSPLRELSRNDQAPSFPMQGGAVEAKGGRQ